LANSASRGLAVGLFWVTILSLSVLLAFVGTHVLHGGHIWGDEAILRLVYAHRSEQLTAFLSAWTHLGSGWLLGPICLTICGLLWARARWDALFCAASTFGAIALNASLKLVFHRVRPALFVPLGNADGFSFPSGHSCQSAAFFCAAGVLIWRHVHHCRALGALACVVCAFGVGCSRIYLQVHYPSDVIAGWIVGTLWVAGAYTAILRRRNSFTS
jgi:membrane-associated phospholipid phosphatase